MQDSGDFVDEADVVYAGFWRRYAALVIDSLVVAIAYYAILFFGIVVAGLGAVGSDPGPVGAGFAIVLVLATAVLPLSKVGIQRQKEVELRRALREMRTAIDRYKDAADLLP